MTDRPIRIGGASGFWGDAARATPQLLAVDGLDYLVYDYLADPHNRPQWQASLRRVEVLDDGPPRVGTRWVDHVVGAPPFHLCITDMEPGDLWAEVGSSGPFTAYGTLLFADAERDGRPGTEVRCIARVRGRGPARVLAPFAMVVAGVLVRNDLKRAARILSAR